MYHAPMAQQLHPTRTAWHITVGAYGSRLHGERVPTVDRAHNQYGSPFLPYDPKRVADERDLMKGEPVWFTLEQRAFIEATLPTVCERGHWLYRVCAAPPPPEHNHFHIMLDAERKRHGKDIRKWLKRWLTESLDEKWGRPESGSWWVEAGSTKAVKELAYLNNAYNYILRQRSTPLDT